MENMSRCWWNWWLDFLWLRYVLEWYWQLICDWTLNLGSRGYVKETMTFGEKQNRSHCNGIWITDIFSWWILNSVMASDIHIFLHILLPMMIRIFSCIYFSDRMVLWQSLVRVWGILEGEKYGWTFCANVGMEWKVSGTEGEGFMPNSSFHISLSTLQHTEVKMLTKKVFVHFYDDRFHWQSCLHEKQRVLEYHVWCIVRKRYSWTLYDIVYSNINLD